MDVNKRFTKYLLREVLTMNATTRKNEIIKAMPSFAKDIYIKEELLPELLQLQSELVNLTFNGEHAEQASLKTWDVYNHLVALNEERDHPVSDEQMHRFWVGCKAITEAIKGEITGNKGECKALRSIETVRAKHTFLRNIELSSGAHKTELDIILFTEKAIFAIEVKNPARDIIIDGKGNYCRNNNGYISFDKNIGEKMNDKTFLLRGVLQEAGIENPNIISLLVFTNNNITVTNNYPYIQHCFLSSLPHLIDNYEGEEIYTDEAISHMVSSVEEAKCTGDYAAPIDVNRFKQEFADLMVTLENLPEEEPEEASDAEEADVLTIEVVPAWLKVAGAVLAVVPVAGLVVATAIGLRKSYQR